MTDTSLACGIEERPPSWWETVLYGWQHTLVDISRSCSRSDFTSPSDRIATRGNP